MSSESAAHAPNATLTFLWTWALLLAPLAVWSCLGVVLFMLADAGVSFESALLRRSFVVVGALASAAGTFQFARERLASRRLKFALTASSGVSAIVLPYATLYAVAYAACQMILCGWPDD